MEAFCPNLSNKQVKTEFDELTLLFGENTAYFLWDKNNGYSLDKAPNGAESILFQALLDAYGGNRAKALEVKAKAYLSEFTDKFGNWLSKDNKIASETVDKNGEPHVESVVENKAKTEETSVHYSKQDTQEPLSEVWAYIENNINTRFRGNYYDFVNRNGRAAYEALKGQLTNEFNAKFKHWKLQLGPNQKGELRGKIVGRKSEDTKDIAKWQSKIFETANNSSAVNNKDLGEILKSLVAEARGVSRHVELVTELVAKVLKDVPISFEISSKGFKSDQAASCEFDGLSYKIRINSEAFFVNTSGFKNNVTQTILHELLHAATEHALRNDKELQTQAESLLKEVRKALGKEAKDYGLTDIFEFFAELSNKDFVDKLKSIQYEQPKEHKASCNGIEFRVKVRESLFDKVKAFVQNIVGDMLRRFRKERVESFNSTVRKTLWESWKYQNSAYEEAMRLLMESALYVDKDPNTADYTPAKYDLVIGTHGLDVQSQIYRQFDILNKYMQRIPNKSAAQQQRLNKIFETLSKLRTLSEIESIQEVLEFAREEFGSFGDDIDGTLLKRLKDSRNLPNPYDDITSEELCEVYQSTIVFFDNLVNNVFQKTNVEGKGSQYINDMMSQIRSSIVDAKSMWKEALDVVTDKLVDKWVNEDLITVDALGDNPTEVIKDYLHRNAFYSDTPNAYAWTFSLGDQQSPLVKLAFNQIQKQEIQIAEEANKVCVKLAKAYDKVDKVTRMNPFWQKTFMEFDRAGIPTGNFIRPINYGQYQLDLDDFVVDLNNKFQQKYGYHYVVDDVVGDYVNSETGESAYDEEWTNTMPTFVEYLLEIQKFKCDHANLRFTYDYYKERLSTPFDANLDPDTVGDNYLNSHHGLSPKTLKEYNRIQSNINYYLNKCKDPKTGKSHPELLENPEDQRKLDMWTDELRQLSNAYREDGSIKSDDELRTAYELKAWQRWIGQQMDNNIDYDAFEAELQQYEDEVNKYTPGTPEYDLAKNAMAIFLKYNSKDGINPELLKMVFGEGTTDDIEFGNVTLARIQRGMLKQTVSGDTLVPNLKKVANNIQFFIDCKKIDQLIEDEGEHKPLQDDFNAYFATNPVLYMTDDGKYLDHNFNKTDNEDEAITFQEFLIEHYTMFAIMNKQIPGLMDDQNNPIMFDLMTDDEIRNFFHELFSIKVLRDDYMTGNKVVEEKPLSVFTYIMPIGNVFFDKNNKPQKTIIHIPQGRFATKASKASTIDYLNYRFDEQDNHSEQPDAQLYDNQKAYDEMASDQNKYDLYTMFINYMREAQKNMQFANELFDYKLPKIEASNEISLLRSIRMGQNVLKAASEQYFNYNSNDAENRTREEQSIGPDQMANHNVPMKYIGTLKDRYKYSNDVVTSVVRYCTAALEYKYKQQILSDLQSIRYAQEPENRAENVTDTPHNREIYDYMMRQHMYKTTKLNTKVDKLSDMARGLGTFQMLGFNFLSVGAGMADSITKIIRDGLIGRYYSGKDLARAMGYNTYNLLNYVLNYGKAVPNNKVTAFCHMFGIKGTKEVADQMNNNRAAAVFAQMALGAYSMLDFNTNNVMMHAILTQYRFYDGNAIPKGFYRDYDLQREFIKAGYTKKDAAKARRQCKTSLWSAYKYRNGELYLDPQYEPYVTTKVKNNVRGTLVYRAQVNNGTTPQDGKPRYTESLFGKFIGAMRGWMVSSIQERISGRDDVSVRKYERVAEETVKNGRLSQRISYKILPRTKDQKEARKSWNFNTALPQPEIAKAFTRSLGVMSQTLFQLLSAEKYKARGFSESELFAIKTVSVELGMILSLIQGYQYVDDWCSDVHPINPRKETPYSPAEIYKSKLYKEWVRNGWIRNVNSQIEQYDPTMVYDIVNSISTLSTAVKNMKDVPSYLMTHDVSNIGDQINKDKVNTVKQGKFKGYTQWESTLLKSIGLINNIQTAFTYNGVSTNTAYYARNYSWWMKFMGEEYKPQKSHTSKKKNKSTFELDDLNDDFNEGGSFDSDFSDIDF